MLLFARRAEKKPPTTRSRGGCIPCKEKKKKCNEGQPQCNRCVERNLKCEYKGDTPRKRRRTQSPNPLQSTPLHLEDIALFSPDPLSDNALFKCQGPLSYPSTPNWDSAITETSLGSIVEDKHGVEEIVRPVNTAGRSSSSQQNSSLARIAPMPLASPLLDFRSPLFMEIVEERNRRLLIGHFTDMLSPLIIFTVEETVNPFQELVLPMSAHSPPLLNALLALSCAHLEYKGILNEERSLDFHTRALQELGEAVKNHEASDETLATIVMLIYYEVLVHRGSSNSVSGHLKGALGVIQARPQNNPSPTNRFLQRALNFFDTITALSFGTSPNSPTATPGPLSFPSQYPPTPSVDTLLGMTTELWPLIHEISILHNMRKELSAVENAGFHAAALALRSELSSKADAVELALKNWRPLKRNGQTTASLDFCTVRADTEKGRRIDNRIQSIICNAEAYRQAAFVYLDRNIKCISRGSSTVQYHAKATLAACLRVVMYEGPLAAILWPLFIGACEVFKEVDRVVARTAFREAVSRQGFQNIEQAWEVVEEVWRRGDVELREVSWEEVCQERGVNIVFG
ncbi:hypothetical protein BLS_009223 [Venturia inaequalis]|uniref:Zn(2)-C6 fungal-type domain-containing protein n=1 Tax=Venturia inaequalis TaxID=5025 RepID=A0A8H3V0S9_VENIN|nr:hypothetical protein BLS_009223 [Venturia inaequalis]KAE9987653.1 hypothetical protein EG327_003690 [Venturia inaequalis]RDI80671.1 hypothetical protein Vi05172_g9359 [Venturia inaequalis]